MTLIELIFEYSDIIRNGLGRVRAMQRLVDLGVPFDVREAIECTVDARGNLVGSNGNFYNLEERG